MKKMISLMMAVLLSLSMMCSTAFAANASDYEPYGFSWYDDEAKVWHAQFYEYDSKAEAYRISDRVVVKDNLLYDMAGTLIVSDVATFNEDEPTVVFDADGCLYFTSTNGETRRMSCSLDNYYQVSTTKSKYFETDEEGLAYKVRGTNVNKKVSALKFTGSYMRHVDPVVTEGYVKMYAVDGDAEKIGYDAYYNNKVVVTTYCKDARVWVETVKLLISENAKGAKFVGYTAQYGVMLYDLDGSVLLFKYEDGFEKCTVLYKDIEVYYFTKDSKGFISGIVTKNGTYSVSTKLNFPGTEMNNGNNSGTSNSGSNAGSTGSVTEVKNFQSKSMAYNGSEFLGTLALKSKKLSWKGTELKNSSDSVEFGISASLTPYWINGDDALYYFDGTSSCLIDSNVLRLKYDDSGRVTKYKDSSGNWHELW